MIQHLRRKDNARKLYKKYGKAVYYDTFKELRTTCKLRIKEPYDMYIHNTETNNKQLWRFINETKTHKNSWYYEVQGCGTFSTTEHNEYIFVLLRQRLCAA